MNIIAPTGSQFKLAAKPLNSLGLPGVASNIQFIVNDPVLMQLSDDPEFPGDPTRKLVTVGGHNGQNTGFEVKADTDNGPISVQGNLTAGNPPLPAVEIELEAGVPYIP